MKRPLVGMVAILILAIGALTTPVTYAQSCCTCTCYAHERRPDLATIARGDAKDWIVEAEAAGRPTGTEPRVSAIVVFQPGVQGADLTRGHVAYVESEYSPTSFRISEKGWYDPPRWNDRCAVHYRDASTGDGVAFIYISTYDTPFLDDTELEDKSAMSLQCIRRFLNEQGSYFKDEVSDVDGQPLDLAREVYDAAQTYSINPKVILTTLEKESTAITRQTRPSDNGMRNLTGCSWGSTAREQVACTAERFRAYHDAQKSGGTTPNGWRVGVSKETQDHVTVTPATMAVAGQFAYTPYAGLQWGGDDPRWGGVFLFYDAWYNKFYFDTYICPSNVDVALIIDGTGSMNTNDPNDLRKEAAKVFIDASQFGDRIAVVAFNTNSYHYAPLRTIQSGADKDMLKAATDQVSSSGCTNLNVGLQGGFDELLTGTADSNGKAAVFLTDGRQECSGPYDPQSHLQYKDRGWPIYTVGLGDGADQNLLRQIATDTGGQYIALTDPNQLQAVYFEILQLIAGGNIVLNTSVPMTQGSSQQMTVSLPSSQSAAIFFTGWQGSEVSMSLTTPSGRQIGSLITDPDVYHAKGLTYEVYIVQHPEAGQWILDLFGTSLPSGGELVDIRVAVHGPRFVYLPVICKNYTPGLGPTNHPPNTPSNPSPADGATDQSIDVNLNWTGGDPDGDSVTYDVYFEAGDSTPDVLICNDVGSAFYDPGTLSHSAHYYWRVVARDSHGATATGPVWEFTTTSPNNPPNTPSSSSPSDGATDQSVNVDLSWTGGDPDGDSVTYDVYFEAGDSTPDMLICGGVIGAPCYPGALRYGTRYYWQVIARDSHAAATTGPVWDFATVSDNSPNTPSNPSPADAAINQEINVDLSWTGGDQDGDRVTYDVYFEADDNTPDVLICHEVTSAFCDPGTLSYETHYYWRVVASDDYGLTGTGPVWDFISAPSTVQALDFKVNFQARYNADDRPQNVPIKVRIKSFSGDQTLLETAWVPVVPTGTSDNWGTASVDVSSAALTLGEAYQVVVQGAMHLAKQVTLSLTDSLTIDYTDPALNPDGVLWACDVNQDNVVDSMDLDIVGLYFGVTSPIDPDPFSEVYRSDQNGDGVVDIEDLVICGSNHGKVGD